jgi:hypothetical protein
MPILPFLYLPDAVTLIFLLVTFSLLRSVAIHHINQELLTIREEMLFYWVKNGLDHKDKGYLALRNLIDASMSLVPRLSPARFVFIYLLRKRRSKTGRILGLPNPSAECSRMVECIDNANGRKKLRRLQMEMNLALGTFFLAGSLSGWFLLFVLIPRMLRRTILHGRDHRTDFFFDLLERVLGTVGRQAQQIGHAVESCSN